MDWDGAAWMDPAWDFVPMALQAVPFMLEGYRTVAPRGADTSLEARILWHQVQYALFGLRSAEGREQVQNRLLRLRAGIAGILELPGGGWDR